MLFPKSHLTFLNWPHPLRDPISVLCLILQAPPWGSKLYTLHEAQSLSAFCAHVLESTCPSFHVPKVRSCEYEPLPKVHRPCPSTFLILKPSLGPLLSTAFYTLPKRSFASLTYQGPSNNCSHSHQGNLNQNICPDCFEKLKAPNFKIIRNVLIDFMD